MITGASGFLGGHLCRQAQQEWEVMGAYHANKTIPAGVHAVHMDLAEAPAVLEILEAADPGYIIHAAVLQVDACERDPRLAQLVNVEATRTIAGWCARRKRRLVYISSDLVFDGARRWYRETEVPRPVMRYGEYKLSAEKTVLEICSQACVARLPLLYGFPAAGGSNFFLSMMQSLQRGEKVRVFSDQYRTPGLVDNMAEAVLELADSDFRGVLHIAGTQRCSREEMARGACRLMSFNESLLEPISMFEVRMPAPRPQDVSLDSSEAQRILKTKLMGYEEGLSTILNSDN